PAVRGARAAHRGGLAQRRRGRVLRGPPPSRRVGGLGGGAKGPVECAVLDTGAVGLRPLLRAPRFGPLPARRAAVRRRPAQPAHGRDAAVCALAAGLLAPRAAAAGRRSGNEDRGSRIEDRAWLFSILDPRSSILHSFTSPRREIAPPGAGRWGLRDHAAGPAG